MAQRIESDLPDSTEADAVADGIGQDRETRAHSGRAGLLFAGVVAAAAVGGGVVGPQRPATRRWFDTLDKPRVQPPDSVFGPVWSALYPMIAAAGWTVWREADSAERRRALQLWSAQMAANAAWSPVFFGLKRPRWALAVLTAQLATTGAFVAQNARRHRTAAALMGPYLAWSGFAFGLNAAIVRRNPSSRQSG